MPFVRLTLAGQRLDTYRGNALLQATGSAVASGLGDVLVRAKYNVLRRGGSGVAIGGEARLPTGDPDNLLGTGEAAFRPRVIGSIENAQAGLHGELGYVMGGLSRELDFATAVTAVVWPTVTLIGELAGRRLDTVRRLMEMYGSPSASIRRGNAPLDRAPAIHDARCRHRRSQMECRKHVARQRQRDPTADRCGSERAMGTDDQRGLFLRTVTPMPRELGVADPVESFPSESETSRDSFTVALLRHSADRWQPPVPDGAIVLTARETAGAIELFAPEAGLDPAGAGDGPIATELDLELHTFGGAPLGDATIVYRIDELASWVEPHAVADDAGLVALPAPATGPSVDRLARVTWVTAAALLLVTIVGAWFAFRIRPGGAVDEEKQVSSAAVVTAPADLVHSAPAIEAAPLASSVAPHAVTTEPQDATDQVSGGALALARQLEYGRQEPARLPLAIESRRTGIVATLPPVPRQPRPR